MATTANGTHEDVEHHPLTNGTGKTNGKGLHSKSLSRRISSPMMPAFMVSAPGKVIVFGEHAVVHGKVSKRYMRCAPCARIELQSQVV